MAGESGLRTLAESYMGTAIQECEWIGAVGRAVTKLEWIISREGDAGGERRKPYYIAQLIAEAVRAERFRIYLESRYEDKKRTARAGAQGNSQNQPHYSMARAEMQ